jgi:hypothetical protein
MESTIYCTAVATAMLGKSANKIAKEQFSQKFEKANVAILGENTIRHNADNSITTKKEIKKAKKRHVTAKGYYFCNCGFVVQSSNGEKGGAKNMAVKLRLHRKVCSEEKK